MMEYTNKYWKMLMPLIKRSLTKRLGKEETAELIKKADTVYRDMLNRIDDVGKDNPMASNIYECLVFLAVWKASDGKITVDGLREITREIMSTPILKAAGLMHAKLIREQTLASGGEMCDYWFVGDKSMAAK